MFDWQAAAAADNDGEKKTLSGSFWIFWATALPLTLLVLSLWWLWWCVSRFFYAEKFKDAGRVPRGLGMGGLVGWVGKLRERRRGSVLAGEGEVERVKVVKGGV
jgi:hypothetical protein